jgi:hypothetical protein
MGSVRTSISIPLLIQKGSPMIPDIQMQAELEKLFHKNETMPRLRSEFRQPEIIDQCIDHNIPMAYLVDLQIYITPKS